MREIKFRAWINDYALMADVNFLNIDYKEIVVMIDENDYEFGCGEYELMQYTGLKDKNGTEIYEGDIVKISCQENRITWDYFERTGQVVFHEGYLQFLLKTDNNSLGFDLFELSGNEYYEVHASEVIGNIYENPELLEEGEE